jgi:hypothetical protein
MALEDVPIAPVATAPEPRLARFLDDVDSRLDALVAEGLHHRLPSFAPADYVQVHGVLAALAVPPLRGERFLEWGSALGAVTGIAASLGFRASGVEIDAEMALISRDLLAAHGLAAEIVEGSFVPDAHEIPAELDDPDTDTLQSGEPAYDELGREIDEFAIVYAYPWPDMRDAFLDLFDAHAASGALLVTFEGRDGVCVRRKL